MPGTVLRASGSKKNVKLFLERSQLSPSAVYFKGEPRSASSSKPSRVSGFNLFVSNASGHHFERQAKDALRFLLEQAAELRRLRRLKLRGVLDFGVHMSPGQVMRSWRMPLNLIEEAAKHGVELEISYYGEHVR